MLRISTVRESGRTPPGFDRDVALFLRAQRVVPKDLDGILRATRSRLAASPIVGSSSQERSPERQNRGVGMPTIDRLHRTSMRGATFMFVAVVAAVVALCTVGAANANTFGPNGGGSGTGGVFCDHVGHRLTFNFTAHPETRVEADQGFTGISTAGLHTVVVPM
jgi:hypothetical protein